MIYLLRPDTIPNPENMVCCTMDVAFNDGNSVKGTRCIIITKDHLNNEEKLKTK